MLNSIFTRNLNSSLEDVMNNTIRYDDVRWREWMRLVSAESRRTGEADEYQFFWRHNRQEFFTLTVEETKTFRKMTDALSTITGSYNQIGLYLWLVTNNKLDFFFNNLKEKLNANTQTA